MLKTRLAEEYGLPIDFERRPLHHRPLVLGRGAARARRFVEAKRSALAEDRDGNPVYLARNGWDLGRVQEDFPKVRFTATRERHS